ncbi:glycosyltransferase [Luteolibacter marinus]|uniref:glycosyltransferase n=1 Tax=Luteolibacter marinus TaxID=2776705 RepID=UPI00186864BF|nr:nucleotide disphospho-sugar-binding domain-containing protein [Luteolibacter marinus]
MKKIILVGPPFSGHLHPLLGIGRRLAPDAEVLVVSTPGGVKAAAAAGLKGIAIMADHEARVWEIAEPGIGVKNHPLKLWRQLKANVGLMTGMKRELDVLFAAERPDLVIADYVVPVAGLAATPLGIPWWTTLSSPCVFETPDGPPAYFGGQFPATRWHQHARHAVMRTATRRFKRLMRWLFRREFGAMGFTDIYRPDGSEACYSPQCVLALGCPEIEFPRRYPPQFHLTGPILYTPPFTGEAPAFRDDGRPHVLVTIGTHLPHAKATMAAAIRAIARRHPDLVFHFSHGKESAPRSRKEENFDEYPFISYLDHLHRYDLVVHHAGSGVLHHCLRHGIPAVVHPLDYDQFDYAARLVAAGAALPARRIGDLEAAILRALGDAGLKKKCQELARALANRRAEDRIAAMVLGG